MTLTGEATALPAGPVGLRGFTHVADLGDAHALFHRSTCFSLWREHATPLGRAADVPYFASAYYRYVDTTDTGSPEATYDQAPKGGVMAHAPEQPELYVRENCHGVYAGTVAGGDPEHHRYDPPTECAACGSAEFVEIEEYSHMR